ncbi:hypothetical protein SAMN02746009_00841 [Hymenobacter psychrotolerans DSM 18569]|uniref:NHL repeat-containing protein n=1 Tax=Hymenobacter psychrotolerans DSM 18569 TaxID=1121959 RepID=A0A1M6S0H6_9BACT|nr:hypothetical protein SAMN02746009_00841 [Hymenobacter psychrotolerans DSM 18569]
MMAKFWPCGISSRNTAEPIRLARRWWSLFWLLGLLPFASAFAQTTVPTPASVVPPGKPAPAAASPAVAKADEPTNPAGAWQLVRTIALPQPGVASLDRRGTLYVADSRDNIRQYGPDGQALNTFSPPQPGHVAQLEAWNTTKILVFYDDRQQLLLLDRFAAPLGQFNLLDLLDGTARAATLAPDDRLWLLNESDLTLRQFDANAKTFTHSTPLDLLIGRSRPDFRFLREYQNNLYLVDRVNGIYVFDNLGNYRKKLPFAGLNTIGFRGDELYFLADGAIQFFQLYTFSQRTLPLPPAIAADARQVLVGEDYAYVFTAAGVSVYRM